MRAIIAAILVVPMIAHAAPTRVLVADADPELLHALVSSLAPWALTVVAELGPGDPRDRAREAGAQFAVWREGGELVVFDGERNTTERRPARAGALDPVAAAAAALTVKTMMRLPPLETTGTPASAASTPPAVAPAGSEHPTLRLELAIGGRVAPADVDVAGARFRGAVMVHPWSTRAWRVGALVDAGPADDVKASGFVGRWSDLAALAVASWSHAVGGFTLEPSLAVGAARGHLIGSSGPNERDETSYTPRGIAGLSLGHAVGPLSVVAWMGVELSPITPTYTKVEGMSDAQVFDVPALTLSAGVGVAVELGR